MKIVFATLHAKYVHSSLALPCLAAACANLPGTELLLREFTVNEPPEQVLRNMVAERADVVAFSCYIWNIERTLRLADDLKQLHPHTFIILGGPEASYGAFELLELNPAVDCIVRGEGEQTLRECLAALSDGRFDRTAMDIPGLLYRAGAELAVTADRAPLPDLDAIPSPFAAGLADLGKPLVYYETSRGCPFSCAFCMSSLEKGVRSFSAARIESDLLLLMERKVQTVKLVDRTFNFDADRANRIWQFILRNNRTTRFHFEIAADLLTEENFHLLEQVPPGLFRFEIGVQSGEEETLERVGRRTDMARLSVNVRRLVERTGITVHLDLVAGLPQEDYQGFQRSLQQVIELLQPGSMNTSAGGTHIQVEPLKVLKGSPMRRIAREEGYRFSVTPPYKILQTPWLSFSDICRIEDIARLLDQFHNSGRFPATLAVLASLAPLVSFFEGLARFRERRDHEASSLVGLFELCWSFGREFVAGNSGERLREALCYDYCRAEYPGGSGLPAFFTEAGAAGGHGKTREKVASLAKRLDIAAGSRVRTYTRRFSWDHRQPPGVQRDTNLLFVYAAAPGRGLEVRVLEEDADSC